MKRCPECESTYADAELNFCLDDAEWLVYGWRDETRLKDRLKRMDLAE